MVNASSSSSKAKENQPLQRIANLIKDGKAKKIVVLTGAGISTSAGIPDFRSPETGLYANLEKLKLPFPEAVFELNYFKRNPKPFWTLAKDLYPGKYHPTPAHYFLSLLHKHNILLRVFSQNIDTLDTLAGLPASHIIEAHGSFATAHCLSCRKSVSREYVLSAGVRTGNVVKCPECGGLVKPDIVFFGEGLPDRFFKSVNDLSECDLLIIIGTSLQVHPFASLPEMVPSNTPRLLINREAVGPFVASSSRSSRRGKLRGDDGEKRAGDIYWEGDADEGCSRLAVALGWEDELEAAMRDGKKRLEKQWSEAEGASEETSAEGGERPEQRDSKAEASPLVKDIRDNITTKESGKRATSSRKGDLQNQNADLDEHEDEHEDDDDDEEQVEVEEEEEEDEDEDEDEGDFAEEESEDEEEITGKIGAAAISDLNELIQRQLKLAEEGDDAK